MHSYPNKLSIRSLLGVDFWVFHLRDLTLFLICLSWTFTFYYYFIFFSISCIFHCFFFFHTTMMHMKCNEINYPHSQVLQLSNKISINPNINKIIIYTMISLFLNNPNNFNNQIQLLSTIKLQKKAK